MKFRNVAELFNKIERLSSRLKITSLLAEFYKQLNPTEARQFTYLLQGKILPDYYGYDFGIGEKMVEATIAFVTGYSTKDVEALFKKLGDLGLVAEELIKKRKQRALLFKELSISEVYSTLKKIAEISGEGSVTLKQRYLGELLNNSSPLEGRYIVRIVLDRMRIGIGDPTILDALSWSKVGGKELRPYIERAYNLCSDLGLVAESFLKDPGSIKEFKIEVFKPLRPALAERLPSAEEIIKKIGPCGVEYKYDGFRMQIHKKGNEVRIFSRRLERMEHMFPDVVESAKKLPIKEIIFEGEALAFNEKENRFYSFQETMHRRRKYGIKEASKTWPLYVYVFDVMFKEGEDLTLKPFKERREILETIFPFKNLKRTHFKLANTAEDIKDMFNEAMEKNLEGIMAKDLNAPYTAGKREFAWIKLKKSYGKEMDTIDGVVVGYYLGTGARAKFKFGGLLVAVYNEDMDRFETIAKVGSGFTEEEMKWFSEKLNEIKINRPPNNLFYIMKPDFWVEPKLVVEIAYDNITLSSQHTCGFRNGKGYALRFPRFVRLRTDKGIYDITTSKEIKEMYEMGK